MNEQVFKERLKFSILKNFVNMRNTLPRKTGNLSINSFKLKETANGYLIYIDLPKAPYAIYLDDKPKTAGWWKSACKTFINQLAIDLKALERR